MLEKLLLFAVCLIAGGKDFCLQLPMTVPRILRAYNYLMYGILKSEPQNPFENTSLAFI